MRGFHAVQEEYFGFSPCQTDRKIGGLMGYNHGYDYNHGYSRHIQAFLFNFTLLIHTSEK